jgi:hypothetical protein
MGLTCSLRGVLRAALPAMRVLARCCIPALAMLLAAPGYGADDFPPPIETQSGQPVATGGHAPMTAPEAPAAVPDAAPADQAADAQPAPVKPERDVRIEQKRVGRRVSEVIVTPAGFTYHYTMINLEGQDSGSGSVLQPHPGLSVPRFFRIDF